MSVLKSKRNTSKIQFVATAYDIYIETFSFLTRLSARYVRLIGDQIINLAGEVLDNAEKANSIYPSDVQRCNLRREHLLEARASLSALDVHLSHAYSLMLKNPQGCFASSEKKNSVTSKDAIEKIDHMAEHLGCMIDTEGNLLTGVLNSDTNRFKK